MVRASGPATTHGRNTYATVLRFRISTSPKTRSTSAFCCEYGCSGDPRGWMSSVSPARVVVVGEQGGVVDMEAVGGDARRVTDPLGPGPGRLLERPPRSLDVEV